jgi:ATP-dependent RNA helicase DeaD
MPAPEEMIDAGQGDGPQRSEGPRAGFEDTIWFKMDIGRRHNADPRWLLPLLCRRGHITKNEIGAIRIAGTKPCSKYRAPPPAASSPRLKRTASGDNEGEGGVRIEPVQGTPREAAKQNRRSAPPQAGHKAKPYQARPHKAR